MCLCAGVLPSGREQRWPIYYTSKYLLWVYVMLFGRDTVFCFCPLFWVCVDLTKNCGVRVLLQRVRVLQRPTISYDMSAFFPGGGQDLGIDMCLQASPHNHRRLYGLDSAQNHAACCGGAAKSFGRLPSATHTYLASCLPLLSSPSDMDTD